MLRFIQFLFDNNNYALFNTHYKKIIRLMVRQVSRNLFQFDGEVGLNRVNRLPR